MIGSPQDKRHDFLWIIQTFMLENIIENQKVLGWGGIVGDAVAASYRIPARMTARDAALDFWSFFSSSRDDANAPECPDWISMLNDPSYA